jgi:hypothetical protein
VLVEKDENDCFKTWTQIKLTKIITNKKKYSLMMLGRRKKIKKLYSNGILEGLKTVGLPSTR